jgi:UDP-N-acetylglucosamine--N-acetylmuramyl-(pentapeptide) pyrophosphoryl-undecaprenol N-acetylglucosamine transferase
MIAIAAGGTGGHVRPGLAVLEQCVQRQQSVIWFGAEGDLLTPDVRIAYFLPKCPLNRFFWKTSYGMCKAIYIAYNALRLHRPRAVLNFGSYVGGAVSIAAYMLGIPFYIHEQNTILGRSNRLLSFLSKGIWAGLPLNYCKKAILVGNPIAINHCLPPPSERFAGRTGPLRVLIVGGSQGASVFNQALPSVFQALPDRPDIWHQTGLKDCSYVKQAYAANNERHHRIEVFINPISDAYAWADCIISRAGAMTLSECFSVGLGGFCIPLPSSVRQHQTYNSAFAVHHGFVAISQHHLTERLSCILKTLTRETCLDMAQRAYQAGRDMKGAATRILDGIS